MLGLPLRVYLKVYLRSLKLTNVLPTQLPCTNVTSVRFVDSTPFFFSPLCLERFVFPRFPVCLLIVSPICRAHCCTWVYTVGYLIIALSLLFFFVNECMVITCPFSWKQLPRTRLYKVRVNLTVFADFFSFFFQTARATSRYEETTIREE